MNDFWQSVKRNLQQGMQTVSEKTEELTKIGRLKIQIIAVKRDIEKNFTDLGGRVYDILIGNNPAGIENNHEISEIVSATRDLEEKLQQLEANVEQVQSLSRERRTETED